VLWHALILEDDKAQALARIAESSSGKLQPQALASGAGKLLQSILDRARRAQLVGGKGGSDFQAFVLDAGDCG